jgi:hypothetical protein
MNVKLFNISAVMVHTSVAKYGMFLMLQHK